MRILQVVQKPQRRGPEILARQLNKRFSKHGHTVKTIYLYPYGGDKPLPLAEEDTVLQGQETHIFEKVPGFHPILLRHFIRCVEQFQPDIIQVNGSRTIKYGAFAKYFTASPKWVLVYRNIDNPRYWNNDPLRRIFYRRLVMPRIDGVIGVSKQILCDLKMMYALQVPSVYIPYVVDPARLEPIVSRNVARQQFGIPVEVTVVLFIGNLCQQKRPDRFLRVMHQIFRQFPEVEGWLLGDGVLRTELESQARALGLGKVVRFWGYQAQVGPYIAASDLLLVTSDSDGIPTVVQEAGFLGKPTVSTRVGGLPECVVPNKTGLLVDPRDEAGLARATLYLLNNPKRRTEMGKNAQALVEKKFTLDKIVGKHLAFYHQLSSQV